MIKSDHKNSEDMNLKHGFLQKRWRKARSDVIAAFLTKYRSCVMKIKKALRDEDTPVEHERRKSHAKLQPMPDRPIRRVASKLARRPTNELERLRKKGEDWTANDLFRFQYSDPEAGTPEERRLLCYEWLDRLHVISKKYCYLAWYEAAIYACYYRLAPILDPVEKQKIWQEVKQEYAEIFLMGRRIWRRPIHPSRLRVFYDMAMLCTRFGHIEHDQTILLFRDLLADATNFDFKVLNEVEFAKSIDKISRLENHVIDQFYPRRRSSGSNRGSFRSRRNTITDRSPPARRTVNAQPSVDSIDENLDRLSINDTSIVLPATTATAPVSVSATLQIPTIVVQAPSRPNSIYRSNSPRQSVRFENEDEAT